MCLDYERPNTNQWDQLVHEYRRSKEKLEGLSWFCLLAIERIGYLTAFLVSDLASYICCQEIFVDGGLTIPF